MSAEKSKGETEKERAEEQGRREERKEWDNKEKYCKYNAAATANTELPTFIIKKILHFQQ